MQKLTGRRIAALAVSLSLIAAACGGSDGGTDAPASGGELAGMKGTLPLVELSEEFKGRLLEIDPALKDYSYAAETYDTVIVIALAVEVAKTDGIGFASEINGVTRGGEKCTDYATCLELVKAGTDIDYDGVSGPLEFSGNGEPTQASVMTTPSMTQRPHLLRQQHQLMPTLTKYQSWEHAKVMAN
jgi:hypothetical protein